MSETNDQRIYDRCIIRVGQLEEENEKLRDELDQWHRLTAGIELPEYPITEFQPKDLERENAMLRDLVRDMVRWMPCTKPCYRCERYKDPEGCEFDIRRRELGMEVEG